VEQGAKKTVKLDFLKGVDKNVPITYWKAEKEGKYSEYHIGNTWVDDKNFNLCLNYLENEKVSFKNRNEVAVIVLYLNENINGEKTIKNENVKGFSLYSISGKRYCHSLFKRNQDGFQELRKQRFFTPFLSHNDMHKMLHEYIMNDNSNKAYIIFLGNVAKDFEKKQTSKK
jgi:hypothetical protein